MQFTGRVASIASSIFAYFSGCSSFYLTVNKFSDRTKGELRQLFAQRPDEGMLLKEPEASHSEVDKPRSKRSTKGKSCVASWLDDNCHEFIANLNKPKAPSNLAVVDWSSSSDKCLQAPRDQGECGCCYAMASVKLYEWLYCRQRNNQQVKFSEQFLLDCGHLSGLKGCESGNSGQALKFIESYGLMPDSLYKPFLARVETCPLGASPDELSTSSLSKSIIGIENMTHKLLREGPAEWEAALAEQPLVVYFRAEEDFLDYGGGLYESSDCDPDYGHFLLLVGHGSENGHPYWLLSNSFGTDWGQDGYIKLSKRHDKCIGYVLKATAEFKTPPDEAAD